MLSAESFVDLLEKKDLLAPEILLAVRQQLREAAKPLDAAAIAQLLVRQGHLTATLADRLLAAEGGKLESATPPKPTVAKGAKPQAPMPPAAKPAAGSVRGKTVPPLAPLSSLLNEELPPLTGPSSVPLDTLMEADMPVLTAKPGKPTLRRLLRNFLRRLRGKNIEVEAADPRQVKMVLGTWGGAVALLVVVFGVFWYLSPPGADEMLRKAGDAYESGNYAESVQGYQSYLREYSYHPRASYARVRLALAQLRQAAQEAKRAGEWSPAFEVAQTLMRKLPSEAAFEDAQAELGVALAAIGEGLAEQACEHSSPKVVDQLRMIVDDRDEYSRGVAGPARCCSTSTASWRQSEQQVVGGREVAETLTALRQALSKGDAVAACAIAIRSSYDTRSWLRTRVWSKPWRRRSGCCRRR